MPETPVKNTFKKAEKLCSQTRIDILFKEGKTMSAHLFRMVFRAMDSDKFPAVKVLIAVPKKNLKLAVDRNRMKRLIREAYRTSKHKLSETLENSGKGYEIAFIFNGKHCISQQETSIAINTLLDRLILTHEKNSV